MILPDSEMHGPAGEANRGDLEGAIASGAAKAGTWLCLLLALACLPGLLIPQTRGADDLAYDYGRAAYKFLANRFPGSVDFDADPNEEAARLGRFIVGKFAKAGLFPFYGSPVSRILGGLAFLASVAALPALWRRGSRPPMPPEAGVFEGASDETPRRAAKKLRGALIRRGYSFFPEAGEGGSIRFSAEKGKASQWGGFLAALGAAALLFGVAVNARTASEVFAAVGEGQWFDSPELGVSINLKSADLEFEGGARPTKFAGELVIKEKDKPPETLKFGPNKPPRWRGRLVHPAEYGVFDVAFRIFTPGAGSKTVRVKPNRPKEIGEGLPALMYGSGEVSLDRRSPAVFLQIVEGGRADGVGWIGPQMSAPVGAASVGIKEARPWVMFAFRRDPGKIVVLTGGALILIGAGLSFFAFHWRIEGEAFPDGEGSRVVMKCRASAMEPGLKADWSLAIETVAATEAAGEMEEMREPDGAPENERKAEDCLE